MLQYIIAGLVLGGIYAISCAGLIATYVSTGVMNFAFGSMAFFVARLYYYLYVQREWPLIPAAFVSIVVFAPLFMALLYAVLLRYLPQRSQLIRIVAMIGVAVALPEIANIVFGTPNIQAAPGLSPQPPHVFHVFGAAVTMDQLISYICIALILSIGTILIRRTSVGLVVRAVVDSPAMTSLSGTNPSRVAIGVWMVNGLLAGLAGVLSAPILNVTSVDNYALLTTAAFAGVVAARLRNLPVGIAAGLLMGIVTALAQWLLPPASPWTSAVIESIPFVFIVLSLVVFTIRNDVADGTSRVGGALDAALRSSHVSEAHPSRTPRSESTRSATSKRTLSGLTSRLAVPLLNPGVLLALALPLLLSGYRVGLVAQAAAYAIVFLSITLLTGYGGVISLCQITFAGIGALGASQLATVYGWPFGLAVLASGLLSGGIGVAIGALTLRMGELYVALTTLAFGLLMYELVFSLDRFENQGLGVPLLRPSMTLGDTAFAYLVLVVFLVIAIGVTLVRRTTIGLALAAARSSTDGARALGVGVISIRLFTFGLSAFIAAVGGSFLAVYAGAALPASYQALAGLVWLAVLVTFGVRTANAAMFAGLTIVFAANIVSVYLPLSWAPAPIVGFGLGAVLVAKDPEGTVALLNRQLRSAATFVGGIVGRRGRDVNVSAPTTEARG